MKVQQFEFRKNSKDLMIFCALHSDRSASKNGIVSKHDSRSFKKKRAGIRVGCSRVIEVGTVLDPDAGLNQSLNHDLRVCRNLQVHRLASDKFQSLLLQTSS